MGGTVEWTEQQRAELAREYARIGYVAGERWPAPPAELVPEQLLALLRRVPDGAGRAGWVAALGNASPRGGRPSDA
jgi:hypothetical protein